MPARDRYHEHVRNALIKDGWTITHDPLRLKWGVKDMYVDLGAERFLAAQKGQQEIAVEVKTFPGPSQMADLEGAMGQFLVYHDVLAKTEPARTLYLAIIEEVFADLFEDGVGKLLLENRRMRLLVFNPELEVIVRWVA